MTILARVDNIHSRTLLHSRHPSAHVITGSFTVNYQQEANLRITLNIPDEEKVEYFEVESPGGETQILSKFEDGMFTSHSRDCLRMDCGHIAPRFTQIPLLTKMTL